MHEVNMQETVHGGGKEPEYTAAIPDQACLQVRTNFPHTPLPPLKYSVPPTGQLRDVGPGRTCVWPNGLSHGVNPSTVRAVRLFPAHVPTATTGHFSKPLPTTRGEAADGCHPYSPIGSEAEYLLIPLSAPGFLLWGEPFPGFLLSRLSSAREEHVTSPER